MITTTPPLLICELNRATGQLCVQTSAQQASRQRCELGSDSRRRWPGGPGPPSRAPQQQRPQDADRAGATSLLGAGRGATRQRLPALSSNNSHGVERKKWGRRGRIVWKEGNNKNQHPGSDFQSWDTNQLKDKAHFIVTFLSHIKCKHSVKTE